MVVGSIVSSAAALTGLVAAAIAVTGFLAHAAPALAGKSGEILRRATVIGGLIGVGWAMCIVFLSAFVE